MTVQQTHRPAGSVEVLGERHVEVTPGESDLGAVERTIAFDCLSAGTVRDEWRGVPVDRLLRAAGAPGTTTHLVVTAADGLRACLPVSTAMEGVLAFERAGSPLPAPRLVAPGIEGPRAVKDVRRVEAVHLAPGENPQDYEDLGPASDGATGEASTGEGDDPAGRG